MGRVGGFTAIPRAIATAVNPIHELNAVIACPILGAPTTNSVLRIVNSGAQTHWLALFVVCCCFLGTVHAEETVSNRLEFLPQRLDYQTYIADPRQPRFSAILLSGTGGAVQNEIAFGGAFPLLNMNHEAASTERFQLAGMAGVWSRFDLHHTLDMVGTDYRAGISISGTGRLSAWRLQYSHESDHLGDELILRENLSTRIAYRREEIAFGTAYLPSAALRFYTEAGYAFILGDGNRPWRLQAGAEWEGGPSLPLGARGFAAADLQSRQEVGWNVSWTIEAGVVKWNESHTRSMRLFVNYHYGHDPLGEFFRERLNYASIGLAFNF
ncbi:MAG: DUF1207 domain-containing protein [Nitrospirae bacterium]|nr:DUF1207 domain-containing protein [Candidatus Manganitrophaceae bacterium]